MEISREELLKKVSEESGFYQKHVKTVFNAIEKVVLECFEDIDNDEPVSVRLLSYLLLSGRIVPERERVDPRDRRPIVCKPTVKVNAKFSDGFKEKVQKMYDTKKDG